MFPCDCMYRCKHRQCFVFHQAPRQELLGFGSRIDARRFACKVLKETVDHKHKFQSTTLYVWRRIDSGMQTNKVLQVSVYQDLSGFISSENNQLDVSGSSFQHLPNGQALKAKPCYSFGVELAHASDIGRDMKGPHCTCNFRLTLYKICNKT